MALAENGNWVTLTDDEIAACTTARGVAEVITFVPIKDFGQYLSENVAQVRPKRDKGKPNPVSERAFAMLLAGMKARKVGALIKVAMRGPARYAILTPEADLIYVYPADGVRQPAALAEVAVTKAEVAMATTLIDTFGIDTPVLTDDTAPAVQDFVNAKAAGMPAVSHPEMAPVTDLMAAFQASIDAATAAKNKKAS
jgi:non-homologous end joining protein Ku